MEPAFFPGPSGGSEIQRLDVSLRASLVELANFSDVGALVQGLELQAPGGLITAVLLGGAR